MNETKSKKGTKYATLKDEDVHTITGALKQFFRELKTDLIPMNIVKSLPNDLGLLRRKIFEKCIYIIFFSNRITKQFADYSGGNEENQCRHKGTT